MTKYTAKMKHSEETITRLIVMQYNVFQFGKKLVRAGMALILIFIGLYIRSGYMPMLCLLFGCILISGLDLRAKNNARKICSQMNGRYPVSDYYFEDEGFKDHREGELIPYEKIVKLVEDREYFYLYISTQSAYMVDRRSVSADGHKGLMSFLSEKCSMEWSKPHNLLTFRFNLRQHRTMSSSASYGKFRS